jgi:hypothetical protein
LLCMHISFWQINREEEERPWHVCGSAVAPILCQTN